MKKQNVFLVFAFLFTFAFIWDRLNAQVTNGQAVNAAVTNAAFLYKIGDSTAAGKLSLNNSTDPTVSGSAITNIQREFNALSSFTGKPINTVYNYTPIWSNNDVGSTSDSVKNRADSITSLFNSSSGHKHTGAFGDAPQISLTTGVTGVLPNANTTATSSNTASAIVARDSSGNFSAGTITATLSAGGNIILNSNYLSNDGTNHGITINNAGDVTLTQGSNTPSIHAAANSTEFDLYGANILSGSNTTPGKLVLNAGLGTGTGVGEISFWVPLEKASGSTAQDTLHRALSVFSNSATDSYVSVQDILKIGAASGDTASIVMNGKTSGAVTIQPQDAAGTYNFNLPTSAGGSGDPLLSGGGGSSAMTFGTLQSGHGGTGNTSYTDGQLLIGNTSTGGLTKATLTQGSNITITNGGGSITIAASSSATPAYTYVSQSSTLNPAVLGNYYLLSGASFNITLPDASVAGSAGKSIIFQHNGTSLTQTYTFLTTSSQTINGPGGTVASGNYTMYTNGEKLILFSDGTNWQVVTHDTLSAEADAGAISVTSSSAYTFTLASSASITAGTVYTNNGQTFIVSTTSVSSTTLLAYGTGNPGASGTLTFVSGSPSGNKTFNSVSNSQPAFGTNNYHRFIWYRTGQYVNGRWEYSATGAGTTGGGNSYAFYYPTNLQPDATNMAQDSQTNSSPTQPSAIGVGFAFGSGVNGSAICNNSWPTIYTCYAYNNGEWGPTAFLVSQSTSRFSIQMRYRVTGWQP